MVYVIYDVHGISFPFTPVSLLLPFKIEVQEFGTVPLLASGKKQFETQTIRCIRCERTIILFGELFST